MLRVVGGLEPALPPTLDDSAEGGVTMEDKGAHSGRCAIDQYPLPGSQLALAMAALGCALVIGQLLHNGLRIAADPRCGSWPHGRKELLTVETNSS